LALATIGRRPEILKLKESPFNLMENNMYWYMESSRSNGFAPNAEVSLWTADTSDHGGGEGRLSWHLGQNVGGWRSGMTKSLNGDQTWRKIVMYGPCGNSPAGGGVSTFKTKCKEDGDFTTEPKCVPVSCGAPPEMAHATRADAEKVFEETVTYRCESGFSISGEEGGEMEFEGECLASGAYSYPDEDLQCENIDDCKGHSCGPHGSCFDLVNDYTCNCTAGFEIQEEDGEKICGNIDDCDGHDCGAGTCVDHIGSYSCNCPGGYGQEIIDGDKTCAALVCAASPPSLGNGVLKTNHEGPVRYLDKLRYKCDKGWTTDGSSADAKRSFKVKCLIDGNLEPMKTCLPVSCGVAPVHNYAHTISPGRYDLVKHDSPARYRCITGYKLGGNANGDKEFSRECKANGHFAFFGKSCKPVKCGLPPLQNWAIPNQLFVKYGDNLKYTCWLGFSINQKAFGPMQYRRSCQEDGSFSSPHPAFLQLDHEGSTATNNFSFVQTEETNTHHGSDDHDDALVASPEVAAADGDEDGDFFDWSEQDDEDEPESDLADEDMALIGTDSKKSESKESEQTQWGRRRRDRRRRTRRRRTRRRRCSTLTSTTTGYYGCHPVFVPIPCIGNMIVDAVGAVLRFLNPFNWIQLGSKRVNLYHMIEGSQNQTNSVARRIHRATHSTKEDPAPPEPGDSIAYSCPEGYSMNGNPNGARGFTVQLQENGEWDPPLPDPGCIEIKYLIQGSVVDAFTGLKLSDARVKIDVSGETCNYENSTTTDDTGKYTFEVCGGEATISVSKGQYWPVSKPLTVEGNIEPDTTATVFLAKIASAHEWIALLSYTWPGEMLDSYTKWGPQTVYFGNKDSMYAGIQASMVGGVEAFSQHEFNLASSRTETSLINLESGCAFSGAEHCDVKFMVNDDADAGNIKGSQAKVTLWQGSELKGEFKIEDCEGSLEAGWWHVFTLSSTDNSLKWDCKDGGEVFLQANSSHPHFAKLPHRNDVDFESYVGPFPGRFWRHSRRHRKNKNSTTSTHTSSFLQHRGGDASPKKLRVGASDVNVRSTA
jgi:hypothetical protein